MSSSLNVKVNLKYSVCFIRSSVLGVLMCFMMVFAVENSMKEDKICHTVRSAGPSYRVFGCLVLLAAVLRVIAMEGVR